MITIKDYKDAVSCDNQIDNNDFRLQFGDNSFNRVNLFIEKQKESDGSMPNMVSTIFHRLTSLGDKIVSEKCFFVKDFPKDFWGIFKYDYIFINDLSVCGVYDDEFGFGLGEFGLVIEMIKVEKNMQFFIGIPESCVWLTDFMEVLETIKNEVSIFECYFRNDLMQCKQYN